MPIPKTWQGLTPPPAPLPRLTLSDADLALSPAERRARKQEAPAPEMYGPTSNQTGQGQQTGQRAQGGSAASGGPGGLILPPPPSIARASSQKVEYRAKLPRLHTSQLSVLQTASKYNTLACGRRWGKSTMGTYILGLPALGYEIDDPDEKRVAWFAPEHKFLSEVWALFQHYFGPQKPTEEYPNGTPSLITRSNENKGRIELVGGGIIEFWSLDNKKAGRSRKYKQIVVDEAAFIPDLERIWEENLLPTLLDFDGGAWLVGTPDGRNFFHKAFQYGQNPDEPLWASWQRSSYENPHISHAALDRLRSTMTERRFRQEILAEFLDDAGSVFPPVRHLATEPVQLNGQEGHKYVMGLDPAKLVDYMGEVILDVTNPKNFIDVYHHRWNRTSWPISVDTVIRDGERFGVSLIIMDKTGIGGPFYDNLRAALSERGAEGKWSCPVIGETFTNDRKAEMIQRLGIRFEQGTIRLLDDPILIQEIEAFEGKETATGKISYNAPPGQHDDMLTALYLANWYGRRGDPESIIRYLGSETALAHYGQDPDVDSGVGDIYSDTDNNFYADPLGWVSTL